mgnify:CR=1 FL=1
MKRETYNRYKHWIPMTVLAGALVFLALTSRGFLSSENILNVLGVCAFVSIPAIGLAGIMISGNFDLSFVGVIGLGSVVSIVMLNAGIPLPVVLATTLMICIACEAVNAFIVVRLGVHPWLATIATMLILLGLEQALSRGEYLALNHPFYEYLRFGSAATIPVIVLALIAVFAAFVVLYEKTKLGTYLYAVGGNSEAAKKAGLPTRKLQVVAYLIMGALCWISSIVYVAKLSGYPPESAYINQLEVILAVFFGMAISRRNVINIVGTFVGSVFVMLLSNGLGLMGVHSYWIKLIEGCLVIFVIIGNSLGREEIVSYE